MNYLRCIQHIVINACIGIGIGFFFLNDPLMGIDLRSTMYQVSALSQGYRGDPKTKIP